ncbi:MAG: DUF2252 domain-containing protein [Solirubrobacterales bacterium]
MPAVLDLAPSEREAVGKAARAKTPRSSHAFWEAGPERPDPVETLERQDRTRVPELVPIRHGRMLASAFTFYRGGAAIMAADLAATPSSELTVQLCGDAHLSNFGGFAAPDRQLIFDINDFDETHPGPFEWDLKRLAASFAIGGRAIGLKKSEGRAPVAAATRAYREEMRRLASMRTLDVWYERLDLQTLEQYRSQVSRGQAKNFDKNVAKAESKNSLRAFDRLTQRENGSVRIVSDPPLIVPIDEFLGVDPAIVEERLMEVFTAYKGTLDRDVRHLVEGYRFVHAAHKVVGVGSVGTRAWILLLLGRDTGDPLFLQAKEAQTSVLEPYTQASEFKQQGRRVVEGQRLMQAASDIFLGWVTAEGPDGKNRDFYVRQLWDGKGSAVVERMTAKTMALYAKLCGWTLARAHARSGDRIAIAAYLGKGDRFDRAICDFAEAYADQNERDYKEVAAAVEGGRLEAVADI